MTGSHEIDFTTGPLLKKIIVYAIPIICVNILQILFTAADVAVLGIFTTDVAVAAVGSTAQIVNLMVGFFTGLSVGANVLVARAVGARDGKRASALVGTSVLVSIIFGTVIMIAGILLSEQMLIWTNCAENVLPYAKKYLQIYFLGMPIIMLYNFSASILRAVGDTLRPLIFLAISGVANIILNIFFIVAVGLDVEGVAIATVVSNLISAVCALVIMIRSDGYAKLTKKHLKIDKSALGELFSIGIPMGLSKCTFSFANLVVYSAINNLGDLVMTANAISKEYDGFIIEALHGISIAALAVISQNLGAKNMARIKKTISLAVVLSVVVGLALGAVLALFGDTLAGIMTDTDKVIEYCVIRLTIMGLLYFVCGIVNVFQETIRGLGYSNLSLIISVIGNIVFRLIFIWVIYPAVAVEGDAAHNYMTICLVWPISWVLMAILSGILLVYLYRKVKNNLFP